MFLLKQKSDKVAFLLKTACNVWPEFQALNKANKAPGHSLSFFSGLTLASPLTWQAGTCLAAFLFLQVLSPEIKRSSLNNLSPAHPAIALVPCYTANSLTFCHHTPEQLTQ